jgi:hypothetical protein
MRHVSYLLVIANLVYFSWNMLQNMPDTQAASLVSPLPPSVRRLEMLHEKAASKVSHGAGPMPIKRNSSSRGASPPRDTAVPRGSAEMGRVEALTESEPPGAVAPALSCYVLGPFLEASELKRVAAHLTKLGYHSRERTTETRIVAGYWTYLPAMARKEALRITHLLEAKNDEDYLIIKGNVISLGVFESRYRAERRVKMLQNYGLKPVLQPRYKTRTVHWLDLDSPDGEKRDVMETIRAEYPDTEVHGTPCQSKSIAAGGGV